MKLSSIFIRFISCLLIFAFTSHSSMAQIKQSDLLLTADSLATGTYKDIFKNFFQLAFDRITSDNKAIEFTSNPFAVMSKLNPELLIDTNYLRYTHLRNLNFSFSGKLDSAYKFNGFSVGIKYAIINRRDETVSRAFAASAQQANEEMNRLNTALDIYISNIDRNPRNPTRMLFTDQKNKLTDGNISFSELDTSFQKVMQHLADSLQAQSILHNINQNIDFNLHMLSQQRYDSLRDLFRKKPLWTIGISDTTYKDQLFLSNLLVNTQYLQGVFNNKKMLGAEINATAAINFTDDSTKAGSDLKRSIFYFEPAINLTLKTRKTQYSWAELKLGASYTHLISGAYTGENKDLFILDGTMRIRIINDIWIPIQIKYDPKTGNVFGFLNVRANFKGLRDLVKG